MSKRRFHPWRSLDELSLDERELAPFVIESERTRIRVMFGVFAAIGLGSVLVWLALTSGLIAFPGLFSTPPLGMFAGLSSAFMAYELLLLFGLRYLVRRRIALPDLPRYGNAFGEVTFVTLLLYFVAHGYNAAYAFDAPIVLVYEIPIILSTLRLSRALSLFTGAVAGAQYAVLAVMFANARPDAITSGDFWYVASVGKALALTASGLVAGLVGRVLRQRIDASITIVRERQRILTTFGQYISPIVAERLLRDEGTAGATELRSVTVMFLDIRGFTTFSEKKSPEEVVDYLNRLFGFMVDTVNRNHGLINKFLGDGFMALFGAPFSDGRDSEHATNAAREIVTELAARCARGDVPATRVGIGIHAGMAVVGSIGSHERKEFTVIGDTVNLAARVEQLNKELGSCILVTDSVHRVLGDGHGGEELPPVRVKGRDEPVRIYKLS